MWSIIGIIIAGILITVYEVPPLLKKNLKRELWVFSFLLILGITLSILKVILIDLPNPLDLLTWIYKPLNNLLFGILK